ncbi:hypothetical protein DSL72_003763 [Monilinia vaccinii-corymbosi]|uniref:Uncharacterized protein n=1 Tax=Monilinia vaccinii-corymbosi TaxID=61207 RepID=A0A8A3P358_9HELO|nr:hypothetical protein DSL72_003763 [Monilinia vaccinii-corymbosi]
MCFKTFYGFTCGHTSPCYLVKCPLTLQNEVFPPCSIPGIHQIFANQYCHGCMRCVWNKEVIIEEEAHKGRHERGECGCEIIFDREERERRERGRELKEREGSTGASGRDGAGRARQRGRGRGRGVAGNAGDQNGGEDKQMEGGGGDNGMIREFNGGFMMSAAPPGHLSPRPNDPASLHPYFEYANNKYMPAGQTDNAGHGNKPTMNRITGVIPGMPILSPPPVTSTSEWHKDMMVIPRSDRMDLFGAYPTAHPTHADQDLFQMPPLPPFPPAGASAWQNASMAPSTCTNIYLGNSYTWSFNPEPVVPSMDHHGSQNQPKVQHPMQTGFTDQFGYQNPQQMDHDTPRDAYNYVGYYMDQSNTNGSLPGGGPQAAVLTADPQTSSLFMLAPMIPALLSSAAGPGMMVRSSDTSLPPLPQGIPRFNADTAAPTAPRHDTDAAVISRRGESDAQADVIHGLRIDQSVGQMNVQTPNTNMQTPPTIVQAPTAVTTTGTTSMDFHTTQATNQGQATMSYDATGQATTQGQSQIESEDTSATINVSILHTPRVISSIARPKSTI